MLPMRMKKAQRFLILTSILVSTLFSGTYAQQSTVFRDGQTAYKRGIQFYQQALYGKAQEELDKAAAYQRAALPANTTLPIFAQKAELYSALCALRLEQADAEKRLLTFIQKNEPSLLATTAKLEVGRYYYAKREYDLAIQFLSKIAWHELTDMNNEQISEAKFELAYCYFVKKQFKQARPLFQQVKGDNSPYYNEANYYFGLTCFFEKDYKEALKSFTLIEKTKKYDNIVPPYICQIHFLLKNYDEVIRYGIPLLKDNSLRDRQIVSQAVGQAYYEQKEYDKALPYIEEFVDKSPKVTEDVFYQLAYTQYRAGKYADAVKNFEQINSLDSKLGQNALYNQGDCLIRLGRKQEAKSVFQRAAAQNFDKALQEDALINYAKLSYELGFDNDAITAFMKVSEGSKYHFEAQELLSKIFLNTRDYDKALSILRKLDKKTNSLREAYQKVCYFRGIQYHKDGNYAEAIKLFEESMTQPVHTETTALANYWKAEALFQSNKYKESINSYERFLIDARNARQLPANSSIGTAQYGIGYSYLRQNDYSNASTAFEKAVDAIRKDSKDKKINDQYVLNFVYPDALVRAADSYLYIGGDSNYKKAGDYYKTIVDNHYPNEDYAMYQLSLIYSLLGKPQQQIATIDQLVSKFPNSPFADDALYGKGSTQINLNDFTEAKRTFDGLILKYPNSEFNSRALYKLGVLSYSKNNTREALDYFKAVVKNNVQSDEAKAAIQRIREIYVEKGDPDGFLAYVSTLQGFNFSDMSKDSLLFEAADKSFSEENWSMAIENFTKYLNNFPNGFNSLSARMNRGRSYYNLKKYAEALPDFAFISEAKNPSAPPSMAEMANLLAAKICYHIDQNYPDAFKYYKRLDALASSPENRFEARIFGMRAAYFAKNSSEIIPLATAFLQEPTATIQNKAEAHYYIAKTHLNNKNYDQAKKSFEESVKLVGDDIRSSEGRYQIAYITYMQRDLTKAMDICFQNNKPLGQHLDWLARNFILIADIYAEQGNLDAAKGTLESLLNNYKGDPTIVKEAETKLANVKKAIGSKSKLKLNSESGELEMINN